MLIQKFLAINKQCLIPNLPILICINGWSFKKLCKRLEKPFSNDFAKLSAEFLLSLIGKTPAHFGYQYSDKIYLILPPELNLWFNGNIQNLNSSVSSLATLCFHKIWKTNFSNLELNEDPLFQTEVCSLPNFSIAIDLLAELQQSCLNDFFDRILLEKVSEFDLLKLSWNEKQKLLVQYKIDLSIYPDSLKLGTCCYKIPLEIPSKEGPIIRKKWVGEKVLVFVDNKDFIFRILLNGYDENYQQESL